MWVYLDPSNNLQGPFTSEQMNTWFKENYFPATLPIKCVNDPNFIALYQFVEKYGTQSPFLDSLIEQEQLERMFHIRHYQQLQQAQQRRAQGAVMDLPQSSLAFGAGGHPLDAHNFGLGGIPSSIGHADHQAEPEAELALEPEPVKASNAVEPVSTKLEDAPIPTSSPWGRTASPQRKKKDESSPVRSATPAESLASSSAATASKAAGKKKKGAAAAAAAAAPVASTAEQEPETSDWDTPVAKPDAAPSKQRNQQQAKSKTVIKLVPHAGNTAETEKPAVPKQAPWAGRIDVSTSGASRQMSLKDIQELEAKKAEELNRQKEREAQQMIIAEAAMLAQLNQQASASAIPSQSTWASPSPWKNAAALKSAAPMSIAKTATKQKSLQEIMMDEERQKRESEQRNEATSATVGKRYVDSVASGAASSSSPAGWTTPAALKAPSVVATGPVLKPVLVSAIPQSSTTNDQHGWNVVGRSGTTTVAAPPRQPTAPTASPAIVPRVVPAAASTTRPTTGPGSTPSTLVQWCRTALRGVQKTSSTVNVDEFIGILMSIPAKESATITMICDDTLGGSTAIDPRKFANEFIHRRRTESAAASSAAAGSTAGNQEAARLLQQRQMQQDQEEGWSTVAIKPTSTTITAEPAASFADANKFVVKTNKKKNKKN
eukprot:jgi/Hompol1/6956/HPOL_002397-RA